MFDVICFSHLRWNFVFQRPQHLLSRCAHSRRVIFVEEPLYTDRLEPTLVEASPVPNLTVLTPELPEGTSPAQALRMQREMFHAWMSGKAPCDYVAWFYTPMATPLLRDLSPLAVVYDCMDELSAFKGAPPELALRERELFHLADLVFTGGHALYEAKQRQHRNVHEFPSSVDILHFGRARAHRPCPPDQALIQRPRFGFHGVIDERMDLELLDAVAAARPTYQFVMLGPVVKIEEKDLPRLANIHYLGQRSYDKLPDYLSGWDVAIMPFAKNEATRFISPTKTPEYLSAGKPVVSTSVRDVVRTYGSRGLARIADGPAAFVQACDRALSEANDPTRIARADSFLSTMSWDRTWAGMEALIVDLVEDRRSRSARRLVLSDAVGAE